MTMNPGESLSFDELMIRGDAAHHEGRYPDALRDSIQAYIVAPPGSVDQGRAARGNAARYDRIGDATANLIAVEVLADYPDTAVELPSTTRGWLDDSLEIHKAAVAADTANPWALRELAYGYMYVGVFLGRELIGRARNGERVPKEEGWDAVDHVEQALIDVANATRMRLDTGELQGRPLDQYTINFVGRAGLLHGVFGSRRQGFKHSRRALEVARFSESLAIDTSNRSLDAEQRVASVERAHLRGKAALWTNIAATTMPRHPRNPVWRDQVLPRVDRAL